MRTRFVEDTNAVLRASVASAEVLDRGDTWLVLKTHSVMQSKREISSADSEMLNQHALANVGDDVEGRVRIDVLADDVIRVRYAEGTSVPENETPMVVGAPAPAKQCSIELRTDDAKGAFQVATRIAKKQGGGALREFVAISTAKLRIAITLDPYRIDVRDAKGKPLTGVGGPEKDNFCSWDAYNTGICRDRNGNTTVAVECFDLLPHEAVYGLGEQFIKLNKTGQTVDLDMVDALGVTTPRSYKNVPFYMTTAGYGVFFNHSSLMTYWVGSRSAADIQVAAEDDFLDYYMMFGDMKRILSLYTDITGKGALPPKWTFGYWQSKISYQSAAETLEIARQMRKHKIPCDVIHLDTHWFKEDWYCDLEFDKERFGDLEDYFKKLKELGIKVSLWQLPYIPDGSKLFNDLKAVDGFVKKANGEIYDCGICFTPSVKERGGVVGIVDYTNPKAVEIHKDAFRRLFRLGAKVIKTDFGEAAPLDGVYHDGTPPHRMHNLYPLLYNRAIFEVTKEETGEGVVWARSAWAGNQRYPLHWGGDNSPNWFNIIPQIEGGLSFGMSGFQFWSQDIGGFCGEIDEELLIRWMQLGMFMSHARIHGSGDREIYKFSPRTMRICRDYIRFRYRLMPYIYGSAAACVEKSLPLARPLVLDYPDDPNTYGLSNQWLFGDAFLVAPIYTPDGKRRVYLPEGEWTEWRSKERIAGPTWLDVTAKLEQLPLYVKEGAVIPMGPVMPYVDAQPTREIELLVSPFAGKGRTEFRMPVDGKFVAVRHSSDGKNHEIKVGKCSAKLRLSVMGKGKVRVSAK